MPLTATQAAVSTTATPWYYTQAHASITTSTTSTVTVDPWIVWNQTITTTASNSVIWTAWLEDDETSDRRTIRQAMVFPPAAPQLSAEQVEAQRAATLRAQGERQLARQKAKALLEQALDDRQRIELANNGWFDLVVHSQDGERRRYRIRRGRSRNVDRIDDEGRKLFTLCAHPAIACPDEDTMLTQKLWLESNEAGFLRMANRS